MQGFGFVWLPRCYFLVTFHFGVCTPSHTPAGKVELSSSSDEE